MLDSLVNSETLPTKLAEVINQFVAEGWVRFVNHPATHALNAIPAVLMFR